MDDLLKRARELGLRSAAMSQEDPAKRNINEQFVELINEADKAVVEAFMNGFNEGNKKNL